jgi:hypothetical protein
VLGLTRLKRCFAAVGAVEAVLLLSEQSRGEIGAADMHSLSHRQWVCNKVKYLICFLF